ncbi:hypothetical protein HELRODRAFT_142647, partial [Helobdella robusta]|uniref:Grh/CP2 DB domain-containing protein n=1 Tax=Helobdella robusta TaxID=6412 RepID=T1EJ65_HELRO
EKEQLETWKQSRPGERILDIDIPQSNGLNDMRIDPEQLSCLNFLWDSQQECSAYIKLNAISTEFTAKRHGGEKGVSFRIQQCTSRPGCPSSDCTPKLIHCASCQVKVFKPKGADRKYKTDKEKIEKKSESEKEKYQPSFEYTVLSE